MAERSATSISTRPSSRAPVSAAASTGTATSTRSWELLAPFAGAQVTVPALYVAGDRDLVVTFKGMDQLIPNLAKFVPNLRKTIMLPGCGHWTQQERPDEVNAALIGFLREL